MSEVIEQTDVKVIEAHIETALVKENLTEKVLAEMEKEYLPLKIKDFEDKEGYELVRASRLKVKALRVLAVKCTKKGREAAQAEVKAWVAKEKEIVARIEKVETYLENQEDEYEAEHNRIKAQKKAAQDAALIERSNLLLSMGAAFTGLSYDLEDVSYELEIIRSSDSDLWNEVMLPKYKAIFDRNEDTRIAEENKKKEEQERLEKEQAELKRQQEELRQQQEDLERQRKEVERQKEEADRAERLRKDQEEEKRWRSRLSELLAISFNGQEAFYKDDSNVVATHRQLIDLSNEEFAAIKDKHNAMVEADRARLESRQQRLLELGVTFGAMGYRYDDLSIPTHFVTENSDAQFDELVDNTKKFIEERKERQRKEKEDHEAAIRQKALDDDRERQRQDAIKREEELAQSTDTDRWKAFLKDLSAVLPPQCKSSRYKKIATMAYEKIEEIKTLKA